MDEDDDEAATDIEERLELDYLLGEDIKEKLIPRAIGWFTGEALQFEELDGDMEEGDFEDEGSSLLNKGAVLFWDFAFLYFLVRRLPFKPVLILGSKS